MKVNYLVLIIWLVALISLVLGPIFLGLFYFGKISPYAVWIDFGVFILSFIGVWILGKEAQ